MTTTDIIAEPWDPPVAAKRLAEIHADVLDFVGRVDQGVSRGDTYYVHDKVTALIRAAERLRDLTSELITTGTEIGEYVPVIEDHLVRTGAMGYPVIEKLHPAAAAAAAEAWAVSAHWCNSGPTLYGPFTGTVEADVWADRNLGRSKACTGWDIGMLSAPVEVTV